MTATEQPSTDEPFAFSEPTLPAKDTAAGIRAELARVNAKIAAGVTECGEDCVICEEGGNNE